MSDSRSPGEGARNGIGIGLLLALAALGLYLITLSRHFSADSLLNALRIEGGSLAQILDPTHLLIEPAAYGWYHLRLLSGWHGGAIVPLQALNALGGAAAVGLLYAIAKALSRSRAIGAAVAAGFAVSGGLWLLSVDAEFVTLPLAAALLALWLILTPPPGLAAKRMLYGLALGAVITLAVLLYLNSVLLLGVAVLRLALQQGSGRRARIGQAALMLLVVVALCLPGGALLLARQSWADWTSQLWQGGGRGYLAFSWLDIPHGAYAFLRTLALYPDQALTEGTWEFLRTAGWGQRAAFAAFHATILLVALMPLYLAIRTGRRLWRRNQRELAALSAWSVLYAAFAIFWVPGDISFWMPLLAAWWLLVAMVSAVADAHEPGASLRSWARRPAVMVLALAIVLGAVNAATAILPRHNLETNSDYRLAREVAAQTTTRDLILTSDDELITLYLVYFGRRTVLPVANPGESTHALALQFDRYLIETRESGGQVYLLQGEKLLVLSP